MNRDVDFLHKVIQSMCVAATPRWFIVLLGVVDQLACSGRPRLEYLNLGCGLLEA